MTERTVYARQRDTGVGYMNTVEDLPIGTPIELRLKNPNLKEWFVYTLWVDGHGIIRHSLDNGRGGSSQSVSNLQLKEIIPKKAVPGWQTEVIAAAGSGLYGVEEVR